MKQSRAFDELTRALRSPRAYPFPVAEVEVVETHISRLFFAGDRVYKVKKPVDLGFLDYSTLERRRHFCEEEVRLNRRLAGGTHLGVASIARGQDGVVRVKGEGEVIEHAVEMVRLPARQMLSERLERGEIDNAWIDRLARVLASFHAAAATGEGVDEHGRPEAVARNVLENFEGTRSAIGDLDGGGELAFGPRLHGLLEERARAFLDERRDLLARRVAEGRIREGHGDLHAGNVCDGPQGLVIYDCIEFSAALRCGDVAGDLAFLAMDLDHRGYEGFGGWLAHAYAERAGDGQLAELLGFYKGYRAMVRAKVACLALRGMDAEDERRADKGREAMRYALLAGSYELPPALVLTCGLPACGKSTLARELAAPLRAVHLRSDVRRKVLAHVPLTSHRAEGYGEGLYSAEMNERTHRSLLDKAAEALRAGHTVLVDATFSRREHRSLFAAAAEELGVPLLVVWIEADDAVIRARLAQRAGDPREVSDADLAVYEKARETFEPPDELPPGRVVRAASGEEPSELAGLRLAEARVGLLGGR